MNNCKFGDDMKFKISFQAWNSWDDCCCEIIYQEKKQNWGVYLICYPACVNCKNLMMITMNYHISIDDIQYLLSRKKELPNYDNQ